MLLRIFTKANSFMKAATDYTNFRGGYNSFKKQPFPKFGTLEKVCQ